MNYCAFIGKELDFRSRKPRDPQAPSAPQPKSPSITSRVEALANEKDGNLPVWVRPPISGREHFSGVGRTKLFEWYKARKIRSISITEPGKQKGTRFYHLQSILDYMATFEVGEYTDLKKAATDQTQGGASSTQPLKPKLPATAASSTGSTDLDQRQAEALRIINEAFEKARGLLAADG